MCSCVFLLWSQSEWSRKPDPLENRNLAEGPDHRNTLDTMPEPLDRWMRDTNDDPMKAASQPDAPRE